MNIQKLLHNITPTHFDFVVQGLSLNSQQVQNGDVFVALQSKKDHGVNYIEQAINNGCVCVLVDSKELECGVPTIRIDDLSTHLVTLAQQMYGNALKIDVIGITGTNGKTSVACFISQLLECLGVKNGLIGTLGISHSKQYSKQTTPDIFTLYRTLNGYEKGDIKTAVLEVSSHGIDQDRITGLNITHAVWTNLTQDHLDYHKDLGSYQQTKARLCSLESVESAILNRDDAHYADFLIAAKGKEIIDFGLDDFDDIRVIKQGFLVTLQNHVFEVPFLGKFNLLNILAAFNTLKAFGFEQEQIIPILHKLKPPKGRMQKINNHLIWIDYAHTPDAIENAISTLQQHYPAHKIRVVFGCGGNRDKNKRKKMGKIASKLANTLILTNDNSRNEDPEAIINDILTGIDDSYKVNITLNRQLAIETAVTTLGENECLLIAGKGHEATQQCKDDSVNLNDIKIIQDAVYLIQKKFKKTRFLLD